MNEPLPFAPPKIADDDIAWACDVLRLPRAAFSGADGNDPRLAVLKSTDTLDIEACPGSGKTTLLVAKLAILARKWTDARRGICVLSHTNVARREIEHSLGSTAAGQRLVSYPHFVGTIHGFVNEFLALPWLRSLGYPVRMIDDEVCQERRWRKLPHGARSGLDKNGHDQSLLKIVDTEFGVGDVRWGKANRLGKDTDTYQAIQTACRSAAEEGFHCYDEMFVWADDLLTKLPGMCVALRERFPMLFIDEVQDNSEAQSSLLHRSFMAGGNPVIRQRYGDSNQAIYRHSGETGGAMTDTFPDPAIRRDIPNSHRFHQTIADIANPMGLAPQSLIGCGPPAAPITSDTSGKHAVFLFSEETLAYVIGAYAAYLQEVFAEQEIQSGIFTVVGAVHRPGEDNNVPRFVGHYWPAYDHELTASEPKPKTFFQYVMAGRRLAHLSGEAHHIVEKLAEGILRLVRLANPTAELPSRKHKHRQILELLAEKQDSRVRYLEFVICFAFGQEIPTSDQWNDRWSGAVVGIAEAVGDIHIDSGSVREFLAWHESRNKGSAEEGQNQRDNVFRHPAAEPKVQIRVGSIHSVKGETHTATLVLDTFFHGHHLTALKPWLLGQKSGKGKESTRNQSRLKQHYVAMTRPTHLLCLAMSEAALAPNEIEELKNRSWQVGRVNAAAVEWL